jgi:hypothetical protein
MASQWERCRVPIPIYRNVIAGRGCALRSSDRCWRHVSVHPEASLSYRVSPYAIERSGLWLFPNKGTKGLTVFLPNAYGDRLFGDSAAPKTSSGLVGRFWRLDTDRSERLSTTVVGMRGQASGGTVQTDGSGYAARLSLNLRTNVTTRLGVLKKALFL